MKGTPGRQVCQHPECERYVHSHGWCGKHWWRIEKYGQPDLPRPRPLAERFWEHVTKTNECWTFAPVNAAGYGRFRPGNAQRRSYVAHRLSFELLIGPIPEGMVLDHLCRNRACVNPEHLEPVSIGENVMRGEGPAPVNAAKQFCLRGHEFTPANTMIRKEGWRNCRTCHMERIWARKRGE